MKKTIGSFEAKTNLSNLLDRVSKGESFTITKRGQPVAILSPHKNNDYESLDTISVKIKTLRKKFKLGGIPLKKLITEGRE